MKKKLMVSLLVSLSLMSILPTGAQAVWKVDSSNNKVWSEKDGSVKIGWNLIDNSWYYLGIDGVPVTGWLKDGDNWYYMWSNGTMAYDSWMTNGGFWYYFDQDGKMVTKTVVVDDKKYDFTKLAIILSENIDSSNIGQDITFKTALTSVENATAIQE